MAINWSQWQGSETSNLTPTADEYSSGWDYDPTGQYRRNITGYSPAGQPTYDSEGNTIFNNYTTGLGPNATYSPGIEHLVDGNWSAVASPHAEANSYLWGGYNDPRFAQIAAMDPAQRDPFQNFIYNNPAALGQLDVRSQPLSSPDTAWYQGGKIPSYWAGQMNMFGYDPTQFGLSPALGQQWMSEMSPQAQHNRNDPDTGLGGMLPLLAIAAAAFTGGSSLGLLGGLGEGLAGLGAGALEGGAGLFGLGTDALAGGLGATELSGAGLVGGLEGALGIPELGLAGQTGGGMFDFGDILGDVFSSGNGGGLGDFLDWGAGNPTGLYPEGGINFSPYASGPGTGVGDAGAFDQWGSHINGGVDGTGVGSPTVFGGQPTLPGGSDIWNNMRTANTLRSVLGGGQSGGTQRNMTQPQGGGIDWGQLLGGGLGYFMNQNNISNQSKELHDLYNQMQAQNFPFSEFYGQARDFADPNKRYQMMLNNPGYLASRDYVTKAQARRNSQTGDIKSGYGDSILADVIGKNAQSWDAQNFDQIKNMTGMGFNNSALTGAAMLKALPDLYKLRASQGTDLGNILTKSGVLGQVPNWLSGAGDFLGSFFGWGE